MDGSDEKRHPIRIAARRTGLSPEVLRAWELRYAAVTPGRTPTGRRLYSDQDIERLRLLRRATLSGRRIGTLADLSPGQLTDLVEEDRQAEREPSALDLDTPLPGELATMLETSLQAIVAMDAPRLEALLCRGQVVLSSVAFIDHLIAPLVRRIGLMWSEGRLEPYHEHLATAVIRGIIGEMLSAPSPEDAPVLVVTTPAGQRHEVGALLAAGSAVSEGWRVLYLGPDLPGADIARAARESGALAVALSIVFPADDPGLASELRDLRRRLPDAVAILAGGGAMSGYARVLDHLGIRQLGDLRALRRTLSEFRGAP